MHEHATRYGPGRLQLAEGSHEALPRCRLEPPHKCSVRGAETIDPPVGRAEDCEHLTGFSGGM
ncbi:MAG: hypothetical protein ABIL62_14080 [Planctomycetota bacterium]